MTTHRLRLGALALVLCLGAVPAPAADGSAANGGPTAAEQAHMNALARQLGDDNAQSTQTADLFGPSDDEKAAAAAAAQREQNQDANIARLNQNVGDLQDQLRRLTGQIEVLNHRIDELDQRIDRMKKDFDYKLCQASAQQLGASAQAGQPNGIPCGGEGQTAAPPAAYVPPQQGADAQPTGVTHLAPPPGVLGTLPQQDATPMPAPVTVPEAPPPAQVASNNTNSQTNTQYEAAMNMLARQQYDAASGAFRNFADANPNDPHAPDALYWLGDVSYVQKDFATASRSFAEVIKKYPTSKRAPESMLKLGQSLIAMDQKDEGCTALRALPAKYPGASRTVLAQAEAVRRSGGCRR